MRQTDFLVIGAGIAGLSAAARLARHGETVVLEGEANLGVHSSGRSAAFAHFGIGDELVRGLTALSLRHFCAAVPDDRPPPATRHAALFIAREDELAELDALEEVHRQLAPEYRRLSGEEAQQIVPVLRTGPEHVTAALLDPQAMKLDADAMLQGHRRDLKTAGGELVLSAPLNALSRQGDRWIADTPGQSYSARVLINAAGAWADEIACMAEVAPLGLRPLRRTAIIFAAPDDVDVSDWPFTKTVGAGFYAEPEGPGRLLASPMDETPVEPCDVQPEEEDIATAAWRVEQATTMTIRRIEHSWAGLRSFLPDQRPAAGFDAQAEGFFWLAGQGGFGLQTSPAMALPVEALVTGGPWPEELREFGIAAEELSPARFDV